MTCNEQDAWQFLVIWEFVIRPGKEKLFEQMYGPDGDWTQLFRHGKGYCGTRLTRDCDDSRRYVTLDFWESRADYERFISQHAAEYEAIDLECEALTELESEVGTLVVLRD